MPTIVEPTDANLARAVEVLRAGGVIAFPTETVYGVGARLHDADAVQQIFELKQRPADLPLSAHLHGIEQARPLVMQWDDALEVLAQRYWPGPLGLISTKHESVSDAVTAGRDTIGLRCPKHDAFLRLSALLGEPIAGTSANRSGQLSPTSARHVAESFAEVDDLLILDGGACGVGIESTMLDLSTEPATVLRAGSISVHEIEDALGARVLIADQVARKQYTSNKPTIVVEPEALGEYLMTVRSTGPRCAVLCFAAEAIGSPHVAIAMPQGAGDYSQRLYAALHEAGAMDGVDQIVVEAPPLSNELWKTIRKRLDAMTG